MKSFKTYLSFVLELIEKTHLGDIGPGNEVEFVKPLRIFTELTHTENQTRGIFWLIILYTTVIYNFHVLLMEKFLDTLQIFL